MSMGRFGDLGDNILQRAQLSNVLQLKNQALIMQRNQSKFNDI